MREQDEIKIESYIPDWEYQTDSLYIVYYPTCDNTYIFQAENQEHAEAFLLSSYQGCECDTTEECNPILHRIFDGDVVHNAMVFGGPGNFYTLTLKAKPLK